MLKPEPQPKRKIAGLTAEQRGAYERAVAEEMAAKSENLAAARPVAQRLKDERKVIAGLVAKLRQAREKAGVSLTELELRTGITKSSLSRAGPLARLAAPT